MSLGLSGCPLFATNELPFIITKNVDCEDTETVIFNVPGYGGLKLLCKMFVLDVTVALLREATTKL